MAKVAFPTTNLSRRLLVRGESVIASTGLTLAAILLGAMAAASGWALKTQRDSLQAARDQQVHATGEMLALASERLLAADDITGLRSLITEAARVYRLDDCRVMLSNGINVADADVSRISPQMPPPAWTGTLPDPSASSDQENDSLSHSFAMTIPGRGTARLELTAADSLVSAGFWEKQAGLGMIGAFGFVALLLVYRHMRARLRAVGAIGEALLAMQQGEQAIEALRVHPEMGAEAEAWNQLLADREQLNKQLLASRAEDSRIQQRDRGGDLEGACDAMWQGLLLIDENLRVRYANGAAAVLMRTKRDDLIGRAIADCVSDENILNAVRAVVDGSLRRRTTVEIRQDAEAGNGVLRFGIRPVRRGDAAAAMVIVEDVTQQRLAEEARNAFVAQATHELRMPLTNIRLYTESALEDGEGDTAMLAKCLNVINQESRRLERIVGDMLSVAEIEAGTLKLRQSDVRLETLFDELRDDYEAQAREREIELVFNLPPKLPVILGDRDKITLALHNLIGNALKYTPPKGTVTITVEADEHQLSVEVSDTGIGINDEECELVFEKFYRSKDRRIANITGSGLGLALAREVIRLHRGDITVRSQIDQGTTFTLTVPNLNQAA